MQSIPSGGRPFGRSGLPGGRWLGSALKKLPLPQIARGCYHPPWFGPKHGCQSARKEAPPLMRSPAALAFRALIMLACAVGIPALALSGTSWSEMLKKVQDFDWSSLAAPFCTTNLSASASLDPVPQFASAASVPTMVQASAAAPPGRFSPAVQDRPLGTLGSAVVPAAYQAPVDLSRTPALSTDAGNALNPPASPADVFRPVENRLRELGATYYLLESWSGQQQLYRFYCKMAVAGSADYTRHFEATESDPLEAMLCVLQRVEAWKQGKTTDEP